MKTSHSASNQYTDINDAIVYRSGFTLGQTSIWYKKSWSAENPFIIINPPTKEDFKNSHVYLGSIHEINLDRIFELMQSEIWSPNGEARYLIESHGLKHTSMSVGDIIGIKSEYYIVDLFGFKRLS